MLSTPLTATEAAPRPGAALARFLELRGHPVLDALGLYWWRRDRAVFQSLPPQREVDLDPRQVDAALRERHLLGVKFTTSADRGELDPLFVCRTPGFTLARVKKSRRPKIRRGQERCELRRLDPDELLALGLELNLETMQRHGRVRAEFGEPAHWARFVRAVRDCSAVSVHGAFREGRLATYVLTCRDGAWLHGLVKMQRTAELEFHTSCALDAWVLAEAAKDPGIEGVVNGWVLGADENLQQYKRSMGFEMLPLRRVTQVHPSLRFLARRWTSRTVGALATGLPRVGPLRSLAKMSAAAFASTAPAAATPRWGP